MIASWKLARTYIEHSPTHSHRYDRRHCNLVPWLEFFMWHHIKYRKIYLQTFNMQTMTSVFDIRLFSYAYSSTGQIAQCQRARSIPMIDSSNPNGNYFHFQYRVEWILFLPNYPSRPLNNNLVVECVDLLYDYFITIFMIRPTSYFLPLFLQGDRHTLIKSHHHLLICPLAS